MKNQKNKIFNISILFIFIIYLLINCSLAEDEKGFGNAFIITPKSVPLNKLINGMTTEEALALNGSVRYEVVVESNGQKIKSVILKNDDSAEISIPAGIKLNIGVGLYLAENGTNDEKINAYLVTDLKKDFIAMANQTVYVDFTLDFSKPAIVNYYFPDGTFINAPGMADITGAVVYYNSNINVPVFTVKSLLLSNTFNILSYNTLNYFEDSLSAPSSEGRIFKVDDNLGTDDPTPGTNRKAYWYIDTAGLNILTNNGSLGSPPTSTNPINFIPKAILSYKDNSRLYLNKVYMFESIKYDLIPADPDAIYYYFLIYKNGMLTIKNTQPADTWTFVTNIDFTPFASIHPELPFILDVEIDADRGGQDTFFASKIGLFYVDRVALDCFADDDYDGAVERLKRLIRIPDPYDDRKSIMITSVKVVGNNIYLGTRYGLYKISKTSKAWNTFRDKSPVGDFVTFDTDSIEKIKNFKNNPISSLESNGTSLPSILVVAAAKSVYFKNVTTGKEKELTVWDGMPFIPSRRLVYDPDYNNIDFYEHGQSPVRFVLWDEQDALNQRFWIATEHGLASIGIADLF